MKSMKLPKYPRELPDDVEVRDFDLGGGKYARVIMEARREVHNGAEHFVLAAQAYEMTKSGEFKAAPLGYPSRTQSTEHTAIASDMGVTIDLDDAWVFVASDFDPKEPGETPVVKLIPTEPADKYGDQVYVTGKGMYQWAEGFADIVARTKAEELQTVLKTSDLRSGFAFRNRRKN